MRLFILYHFFHFRFMLYETMLPERMLDPSVLRIPILHDRAIVYVDNVCFTF